MPQSNGNPPPRGELHQTAIPDQHRTMRKGALLTLLLTFLLTACASTGRQAIVRSAQEQMERAFILEPGKPIGQTFVAPYDGLEGVVLHLAPPPPGDIPAEGVLRLHLRNDPLSPLDIAVAERSFSRIIGPGYYAFNFEPIAHSSGRYYYAFLELVSSDGEISAPVAAGGAETYANGAAYRDHQPQEAQLAFRLRYRPSVLAAGLVNDGLNWLGLLLAGAVLFLVPGWGLLALFWPEWSARHWAEKAALSAGLSLALYPLLYLAAYIAGLRLGPLVAYLPAVMGFFALVAAVGTERQRRIRRREPPPPRRPILPDLALFAVLALVFAARFWIVRDIDLPMFGDSYHHTMIVQILLKNGGLFQSWEPYAELRSFSYHFGLHTFAAVFATITNLRAPDALLWVGQILNGMAVLAVYPLASRIAGGSRWAGIAAVLLAGLLSPMPNFYTNWGRYTQLAGQVILPAFAFLAWEALEERRGFWRSALSAVVLGGLALTHYRVLIIAALFLVAVVIARIGVRFWHAVARAAMISITGALLFLPWLPRLLASRFASNAAAHVTTPAGEMSAYTVSANAIGALNQYLPHWLWLLAFAAAGLLLWRRSRLGAVVSIWALFSFLAANPHWLGLPGALVLTNFAVFLAAYIPAAVLGGAALGWAADALTERDQSGGSAVGLILLLLVVTTGVWGARRRIAEVRPEQYALASRPDLRAAAWIEARTPEDASFLVDGFFAYGGSLVAGSDAGWWLPVIAERETSLPPLTYGSERSSDGNLRTQVDEVYRRVTEHGVTHPQTLALLRSRGYDYVYVGQQHGGVNSPGPSLSVDAMLESPHFQPVYHRDRVWIFHIEPSGSE